MLYREIYQRKLRPEEVVRKTLEMSEMFDEPISGYIPDPQKPEVESYIRELGLPVFTVNRKDCVGPGGRKVSYMRLIDMLGPDPVTGVPKFFLMAEGAERGFGAPHSIREFSNLRRKSEALDEFSTGAIQGDDHSVDNARYFLASRPAPARRRRDINEEFDRHARYVLEKRKRGIPRPLIGRYPGLVS